MDFFAALAKTFENLETFAFKLTATN